MAAGLSWVASRLPGRGLHGARRPNYLPGHNHSFEGCHTHGDHLHCGAHAGEDDGHDHEDHDQAGDVPVVDLRSERFDVRGGLRNPFAGFSALRLRAGVTDYVHDEVEDGAVSTTFKTRPTTPAWNCSTSPLPGSRASSACRPRSASSAPKAKRPMCSPNRHPQGGACLCWRNTARATGALKRPAPRPPDGQRRRPAGHRAQPQRHLGIAGAVWRFTPGYQVGTSFTRASRAPSAEELYARGLHMTTSTYERGNADLRSETLAKHRREPEEDQATTPPLA